ncbi:hypothetical protein [Bifidobacterium tibiigranuli]|jgi:hypothetical protein|uniref:hypothetical protein n=1 Tax=Bifidobacterium tibiigranuli TaxID=2172043 RepID=UPI0026EC5928|nr:hypothetical protein [Bifidobacterium tibiigranuli]MCI2185200.1 hypothetical protein [Bifidobacterium tibiigranuli]MCI2203235.1 hypothetical protein [Bifidobacterium tibiigranuli]
MESEPTEQEQTEHAPRWLFPSVIAKLPPEEQPEQWERTARYLHQRAKTLYKGRATWKSRAEAYSEALDAIIELAQNAHITL